MFCLKDESAYIENFNNCTLWYTPNPKQAFEFSRLLEAEIVAHSLNRLACSRLQVCSKEVV